MEMRSFILFAHGLVGLEVESFQCISNTEAFFLLLILPISSAPSFSPRLPPATPTVTRTWSRCCLVGFNRHTVVDLRAGLLHHTDQHHLFSTHTNNTTTWAHPAIMRGITRRIGICVRPKLTLLARTLSLVVSWLILFYHAASAYLCTFLPSDPLYMSFSVTSYAWYGCALAVLGIYGSYKVRDFNSSARISLLTRVQRSPTFLTIFSNHLLIDTVLSLVPKIGLVYLFHDLTADLCFTSKLNTSFWFPSSTSPLHGPGRVIQTSSPEETLVASLRARRHCESSLLIAQIAFIGLLVFWTVAQWGLGLSVRRYAVKLEMQNCALMQGNARMDEEKAFYEEESLADGYQDAVKAVQQWTWREKDSTIFVTEAEKPS